MNLKYYLRMFFPLLLTYFLFRMDGGTFHDIGDLNVNNQNALSYYHMEQAKKVLDEQRHHNHFYLFVEGEKKLLIPYEKSFVFPGYAIVDKPFFFENKAVNATFHSQFHLLQVKETTPDHYEITSQYRPEGVLNIVLFLCILLIYIRMVRTNFSFIRQKPATAPKTKAKKSPRRKK